MKIKMLSILITVIMTAAGLTLAFNHAGGEEINNFNGRGGPTEDLVYLKGDGRLMDSHMYFEIERNVPLASASMKVTTVGSENGPWITDPSIDVGLDSRDEWSYSGKGYGDFGRTTVYSDDSEMKTNIYSGAANSRMGDVILPTDSEIYSAEMTVKGRFEAEIGSMEKAGDAGRISYSPEWVVIGDLDGDGKNDSVVSTGDSGSMYTYIQETGASYDKTKISAPTSYSDYLLYDVDSDNDLDIVYSNSNGIHYLKNDGTGSFSSTSTTLNSQFKPDFLVLGDLDNDGKDEIIGGRKTWTWTSSASVISYLKRNTTTTFDLWPLFNTGTGTGTFTLIGVKVGDWNDDGYTDVFTAFSNRMVYTFENPAYYSYYNDTTNITTKTRWGSDHVFTESYTINGWDVGDVDKDGRADVVIAPDYYYGDIRYHRNMGTSSWSTYNVVSFSLYTPWDVSLVDFNGDGYLDVFFTSGSYYYNNRIGWSRNDQTPNQNSWSSYSLMYQQDTTGKTVFKGDADNDGYMDTGLFLPNNKQIIYWSNAAPNDGSNIKAGFIEDGGLVQLRDLEIADINDDGLDDMVITASGSGTVGWYENDGTPFNGNWPFHRINGVIVSGAREVAPGDIDGDGDLDVAVTAYDMSRVMWFENPGDGTGIWEYHYVGYMRYIHGVGLGDFDEDGAMDIVVSAGYYYSDGIRMYYTSNPEGSWSYRRISPAVSYCGAINVTDMNQDGHLDVIVPVNGYSGQVNIYRNPLPSSNPRNVQWAQISTVSGLSYPYEGLPIDINDDGNLDIVASSNYGGVKWSQAPSNPNSASGWTTYTMDSSINYPWGLAVGDVDDDGYDDVFVSSHYWWASSWYSYGRGLFWLEERDDPYSTWQKRTLDNSLQETYGVALTDLDKDNEPEIFTLSMYNDKFEYSKPELNYPSDISIDIAGDGLVDFQGSGPLRGDMEVDLSSEFQRVLDTKPNTVAFITDGWGNNIGQIPIDLYSGTLGRVTGYEIDIRYNVTIEIDNNGELKESISRIIPEYSDPEDEDLKVYIAFKGDSMGSARISDLTIEYNAPPRPAKDLPNEITIKENTLERNILDLSQYFKDDYDDPSMLNFEVRTVGPSSDKVAVYIENGANLTIDTRLDEDFDRETKMLVTVTDNGGPGGVPSRSIVSNEITIDVLPVDDHPLKGNETLPNRIIAYEGEETMVIDLSEYNLFYDPDDPFGTNIRYYVEMNPEGTDPRDLSNITFNQPSSNGKFTVKCEGDWHGLSIPIKVWGYDLGPDGYLRDPVNDPYHMTLLDVLNINDPPTWKIVPMISVLEDEERNGIFDLTPFVMDIDNDPARDLTFKLISQTNASFYRVSMGTDDTSKINIIPMVDDWNGFIDTMIEVSDGEYTAITDVQIYVEPVNDLPVLNIVSPLEDQSFEEGPISVQGTADDVEGIEAIYITYFGREIPASGKNSWGNTLELPDDVDIVEIRYNIPIIVTIHDTDGQTLTKMVNITMIPKPDRPPGDTDGDTYWDHEDDFPTDPSEWIDSDRDGVGDNEDVFPNNSDWIYDSDEDGIADAADDDPFDPMIPNDPPPPPPKQDAQEEVSWLVPILFFILAGILLVVAILSLVALIIKVSASKDPKKSVDFYRKQEKRRELYAKISGREAIENALTKTQIKEINMGVGPSPAPTNIPTPQRAGAPLPPPMAGQGRAQLPPPGQQKMSPPQMRGMPPRRP